MRWKREQAVSDVRWKIFLWFLLISKETSYPFPKLLPITDEKTKTKDEHRAHDQHPLIIMKGWVSLHTSSELIPVSVAWSD